jgi:hypothetical protein
MESRDFISTTLFRGFDFGNQGIISCTNAPKHYSHSLFHIKSSSNTILKLRLNKDRIVK